MTRQHAERLLAVRISMKDRIRNTRIRDLTQIDKKCFGNYSLKSRRLTWAGLIARMDQSRNAYRVLLGKPEGKRPLGRPRRRWEDNIKMDLREVGCGPGEWTDLAEDRDLGELM